MIKKRGLIFLMLLTLCFNLNLVSVSASEIKLIEENETTEENELYILRKYSLLPEQDFESIKGLVESEFEKDKYKYSIISSDIEPVYSKQTEVFEKSKSLVVGSSDRNSAINSFEQSINCDENGYSGVLYIQPYSLSVKENEYKTETETYYTTETKTVNQTFYGLEGNDVSLIPQSINYEGVTFSRIATIGFTPTNNESIQNDADTAVSRFYDATATYRGQVQVPHQRTSTSVKNYLATVKYSGECQKDIHVENILNLKYKGEKIEEPIIVEPEPELEENKSILPAFAAVGATGVSGFLIFIVAFFSAKNIKVYSHDPDIENAFGYKIGRVGIKNGVIDISKFNSVAMSNVYILTTNTRTGRKYSGRSIKVRNGDKVEITAFIPNISQKNYKTEHIIF